MVSFSFWLSWYLRTRMLWRQCSETDLLSATTSQFFPSQRWTIIQAWLSVCGLQAELETLWSWRRWICRPSPIFARFTSKSAASSSPNDSLSMLFNYSSPFVLIDIAVLLIMLWCRALFCPSRTVLSLSLSALVVGASIPIHQWNWRVNEGWKEWRIRPSFSSIILCWWW